MLKNNLNSYISTDYSFKFNVTFRDCVNGEILTYYEDFMYCELCKPNSFSFNFE